MEFSLTQNFDRTDSLSPDEQWLGFVLRFLAVLELLALPTIFLPLAWMDAVHQYLGMGDLPHAPIVPYLARTVSIMYSFHGLLALVMSWDVRRYLPLIRVFALAAVAMGVALLTIDILLEFPLWWILSEGPFAIVVGGLLYFLQRLVAGEEGGR